MNNPYILVRFFAANPLTNSGVTIFGIFTESQQS